MSEIVVSDRQHAVAVYSPTVVHKFDDLRLMVEAMSRSGFFKEARDYDRAITLALVGQELGIGPSAAIMGIHIIEGKPSVSANLMASQLKKSGKYNYRVRENTATACCIAFFELSAGKSEEIGVSEFTIEDAKTAGLLRNPTWQKYPKAMLFNRAMSQGVRTFAPDVFGGSAVYYEGEIEESLPTPDKEPPKPTGDVATQARPKTGKSVGTIRKEWDFDKDQWAAFCGEIGGEPLAADLIKLADEKGIKSLSDAQLWNAAGRSEWPLPDPKAAKPVATSDWASNDNGYAVFGYTLAGFPTIGALTTADESDDAWKVLERVGFPKDTVAAVADAIFDDCELAEEYRCSVGHTLIVLDFATNATREQHAAALAIVDPFAVLGSVLQEGLGV